MANSNLDFLRFSAYSIKDLITRKLSQDTKFTDQVYEGSNLTILIDIFSHMAQCLLYSLNNTAGESMFSDTQIYENMNRLVKFIGYNPHGISTPTVAMVLNNKEFKNDNSKLKKYENEIIYKYSAIDTEKQDTDGNEIYYSTVETYQINSNDEYEILFYNGIWKLYQTILESNGTEYQKFVLNELQSSASNKKFIVDGMIHVYVKDSSTGKFEQYRAVDEGIFTDNNIHNGSSIYKSDEAIVNIRINEYKNYEITFGNGFTGKIPSIGSQIYIFYLEGNGQDAVLEPNEVFEKQIEHSSSLFGISTPIYNEIFNVSTTSTENSVYEDGKWTNIQKSSDFKEEETVDDIRINAPNWFKTGNRLVTAYDYEYYVKNRFIGNIIDVKCQNNWEYISTFYQWLFNIGLNGKLTKAS